VEAQAHVIPVRVPVEAATPGMKIGERINSLLESLSPRRASLAYFDVHTDPGPAFYDITETVQMHVDRCHVREGTALVATMHTTCGVVINESEPLLFQDFARFLNRLAPSAGEYEHDDMSRRIDVPADEPRNGHSHCQHLLLSPTAILPVSGGRLHLGQWQRIILVELDQGRKRRVTVHTTGH
jgi:secondary thiamine-phosphate synthase enzyme